MPTIGVYVYPGCLASAATGFIDALALANTLAQAGRGSRPFEWTLLSAAGGTVPTATGIGLSTQPIREVNGDLLFVPPMDHAGLGDLIRRLEQRREDVATLAGLGPRPMMAGCSAGFLLAEAGLLKDRAATTSWWLATLFASRYANTRLRPDELVVEDGPITTSGGITSYFDLALRLVGRHGGDGVRQALARVMLLDGARSSQVPYVSPALIAARRAGFMERVDAWMQQHLGQSFDAAVLAAHCQVSQRTLLRRLRKATGTSPLSYLQRLRIERAKTLLESSDLATEDIAKRCGYQDISAFRKLFKRTTSLTPAHYRERFSARR